MALAHSDALTGRPNLRSVFSAAAVISPTPNGPDCGGFPAAIDRTTGVYAVRYVRPLGVHGAPLPASGLRRANGE
jgi:hypothetical protein